MYFLMISGSEKLFIEKLYQHNRKDDFVATIYQAK
jgi:hypothetical protein